MMMPINTFVAIASAVLLVYIAGLYRFFTHFDENRCGMTYMYGYPQFVDVPIPQLSHQNNFENYRLYLYAEGRIVEKVRHLRLTGIPVLFIPGNGGSYKQVRSLASISLHKGLDLKAPFLFNFFTLDLNEEFSAVFGGVLNDQTKFAQESIRTILSLYPNYRKPVSMILVGHSMGGIIAKGLMLDENFDSSAVKVILTLASPHTPIVLFDEYLAAYYRKINLHWHKNTKNVTLISVGGGNRDLHVRGALTRESSADVDVLVTNVPGVWKSTDHLCILWCKSLIKVINRAFFDLVDTTTLQVSQDDELRADVFRYHFQHRSDGKRYSMNLHLPSMKFDVQAQWIEITNSSFHHLEEDGISKTTYLIIPIATLLQNPQNDVVSVDVENLKAVDWIFVCQLNENRDGKYCLYGENLSGHAKIMPSLTQKRKQIHIHLQDINTDAFSHIALKMLPEKDPVSIIVDTYQSHQRIVSTQMPSFFSLRETLIFSTEPGALTYTVEITNLESEIQAGYLLVEHLKCKKQKHYAILQTHIPWSQESTHTFSSYKRQNRLLLKLHRPKPSEETKTATALLSLDPGCTYRISIESSLIDSVAAVVQIYSPYLIPNIIGILLLTLSAQLMNLEEYGECSMYHSVLVKGAQPLKTLLITNFATHILSVLGLIPAPFSQLNLWVSVFYFTVGFALLYFVGFGLWYSLIFSTNKVSDLVLSFLTRYLGSFKVSEWILSGLNQLPFIVSAVMIAMVSSTCGGLSLSLGAIFYYLKLCSLYEDFLNYYIYYPFRIIKNQLKQRLSWKSNAEISDMWRKNMPPSTDDDSNDLTPLHFHFVLFLLWTAVSILNVPSTLVWARNYKYNSHLQPDPSFLPGLVLSFCAALIWPDSCPNPELHFYREISYIIYILACLCFIFCQHTIYFLQYIVALVFILVGVHHFVGTHFLSKRPSKLSVGEDTSLALTENNTTENLALTDSDEAELSNNSEDKAASEELLSLEHRTQSAIYDGTTLPMTAAEFLDLTTPEKVEAVEFSDSKNLNTSDFEKYPQKLSDPMVRDSAEGDKNSVLSPNAPLEIEGGQSHLFDSPLLRTGNSGTEGRTAEEESTESHSNENESNNSDSIEFVTSEENGFVTVTRKTEVNDFQVIPTEDITEESDSEKDDEISSEECSSASENISKSNIEK